MKLRYEHLLSPIRVGNMILRSRMLSSASTPHFLQGTQAHPTEKIITHFANRARNGAALVTINHLHNDSMPLTGRAIDVPPCHFNMFELDDPTAQNYFCQLIDAIHFYGAKVSGYIMGEAMSKKGGPARANGLEPPAPGEGGGPPPMMPGPPLSKDFGPAPGRDKTAQDDGPMMGPDVNAMTRQEMQAFIADYCQQAKDLKALGFDMVSIYACYRNTPMAKLLSPLCNHRTDEYGGSIENRARFLIELFTGLRKAVGPGYPLECVLSVCEPEGGYTVEDTIRVAQLTEGLIDILHLRAGEMDPQHPLGFTSTEELPTPYLPEMGQVTQAVHTLGLNMAVAASAGFQDPEWADRAVAEGKADLIYMGRSWINNPDYGLKVYEGRGEDITPCIRCNKCHVPNGRDMWRSVCSVNPIVGLEDKLERMIRPAEKKRKVAVVGGGPAGMEFARIAAQRGHDVTLYEKSDSLGGLLKHADYPSFKWPLKRFKNFMIAQMDKEGVRVLLNTEATKALLEKEGYDVVAVAIGAKPTAPPLPGKDGSNVRYAMNIYGHEETLGEHVAIIGGGEIGVETGLYLCETGRRVTVLEMLPELISDAPHAHYKNMVMNYWRHEPNFAYRCGVRCTAIEPDGVCYIDHDGTEKKLLADDVLLSIGTAALTEEALALHGAAAYTVVIGDCEKAGNVQRAMRSGFAAASII